VGKYKDLVFVIPCFNEEKTIGSLVNSIRNMGDVLIIDDCSSDNSFKESTKNKALIYKNEINIGYHKSLLKGILLAKRYGYKYCITLDADKQHPIKEIPRIYNILKTNIKLVHTIRGKIDRPGEIFLSFISNLILKIKDPISGFRGYAIQSFPDSFIENQSDIDLIGMNLLLFVVLNKNNEYECIRIKTKKREDKSRYGIGLKTNLKIIKVTFKIIYFFLIKKLFAKKNT
jgi:hypothetical protein